MVCHFAHYDKKTGEKQLLHDHLMNPVEQVIQAIPPSVWFPRLSNGEVKELAKWIYLLHDFGKYTDFFQDYLLKGIISANKGHSFISACITYALLLNNTRQEAIKAYLGFLCVLKHHSSLQVTGILDQEARSVQQRLKRQAEQIQKKLADIFMEAPWGRYIDEHTLRESLQVEKLFENERLFWKMSARLTGKREHANYWYFPIIYLFSLLINMDKVDSSGFERSHLQATEPVKVVYYLRKKIKGRESDLISRRESARRTIVEAIDSLTDEQVYKQRFFTLTAPTGIGKTLASLQAALRLQNRIAKLEGYTPRVITAIPFINIIEQTRHDYEAVFQDSLVVHHRLADFTQQKLSREQEYISVDKQLMLVESWEGKAVLTTFVQLFHSLLTGINRPLKKINKIAGSIVILDEIQSIAHEKTPLIGALIQKVANFYGTRFILMTATQPKLLEQGMKLLRTFIPDENIEKTVAIELLPDYPSYFNHLKRTRFIPCLEKRMDTFLFCDFVLEKINKYKEKQERFPSVLIVVNTIQRSIDVFNQLRKLRKERKFLYRPVLAYLSTNLMPKHRRRVIDFVNKCLKNGKSVILVSTQTIEAGVDLDFDMGFRDLAPLPSLIQTAGRVNREGSKQKGIFLPVYIVRLEKDCSWVYSTNEMIATKELIQEKEQIPESAYQSLIEAYYRRIDAVGLDSNIKEIWEYGVLGLDFEELKKFSLIDSIGEVADVFIEYDQDATRIAKAYRELSKKLTEIDWTIVKDVIPSFVMEHEVSRYTQRSLLRLVSAKLSDYIVQIRIRRIKNNLPLEFGHDSNLFWVPKSEKKLYYSLFTGYIAEQQAYIY
ncbi:CRISPR-associated helicase/endonuclease Cas3 [Desulfotruncus alcoholivorax]|uniref:CRISPR-associated helicase/endonuclease Cas3 n=1 Tax=Desulfotruncus alcoholivorax TaxID=265477 RepID=UPI0003F83DFE|nr:CRISPR-associated helicase/endonuclease Cas3 [Desulfotruncus alcoholivorax]